MNKTLIKKALACMLALTMAAVSSGCESKDDKSSSKVDTSAEVSKGDSNAAGGWFADAPAGGDMPSGGDAPAGGDMPIMEDPPMDESDWEDPRNNPQLAYYDLMDADFKPHFKYRGVDNGVLYYCTQSDSMYEKNIRALDLKSGEDRELISIKNESSYGFVYHDGSFYVSHVEPMGQQGFVFEFKQYIDRYDTDGKLIASFTTKCEAYYDEMHALNIVDITANGTVVLRDGYITPDLKELKPLPESILPKSDYEPSNRIVAGNKLYLLKKKEKITDKPELYYYDFETDALTKVDFDELLDEADGAEDCGVSMYSRDKFLQLRIYYSQNGEEKEKFVILDTDTGAVIARPQERALSDEYHNSDVTYSADTRVRYPADGSDYVPMDEYTAEKPWMWEQFEKGIIPEGFDYGKYWIYTEETENEGDTSNWDEDTDDAGGTIDTLYWYIDAEDPKPTWKCYYKYSDGLVTGNKKIS